jgi:K+-transporting ATPase A subunit
MNMASRIQRDRSIRLKQGFNNIFNWVLTLNSIIFIEIFLILMNTKCLPLTFKPERNKSQTLNIGTPISFQNTMFEKPLNIEVDDQTP